MRSDPVRMLAGGILVIWVLAWILIIGYYLLTPSAGQIPPYDFATHCDAQELARLQGGRVLLLAFDYDEDMLIDDDPSASFDAIDTYNSFSLSAIQAYHKQLILSELSDFFDLVDLTADPAPLGDQKPSVTNPTVIRQLIQENNADGAILVTSTYAHSQVSSLSEILFEQILPKKYLIYLTLQTDNPVPDQFWFASIMQILNRDGAVIWDFSGEASINPEAVSASTLEGIERSFRLWTITIPTQSESQRILAAGIDVYLDYTIWLLQADLAGNADKSYYTDYLAGETPIHTRIFPTTDQEHPPPYDVRSEANAPATVVEQAWLVPIWETAHSSDWRTLGQWAQVKASGVLCLLSLCAFGIVIGLVALLLKITERSDQSYQFTNYVFGSLMMGVMMVGFVTLFLLLRAIF
jgi:hypothetical protein